MTKSSPKSVKYYTKANLYHYKNNLHNKPLLFRNTNICDDCKIGTYKLEHFPPYPRPQCNPGLKHAENYAQFQHK